MTSDLQLGRWYWVARQPRCLLDATGLCMTVDGFTGTFPLDLFEPLTEAAAVDFFREPAGLRERSHFTSEEMRDGWVQEIWDQLARDASLEQAIRDAGREVSPTPGWQARVFRAVDADVRRRASRRARLHTYLIAIAVGACLGGAAGLTFALWWWS